MLIVFGWKIVFKVIGNGVFSCPNCGADRNYERRQARKWFTLFWIPLIPLTVIGDVIRCSYCKNDFRESVLSRPTAGQVGDLLQNAVRAVMVNVLRRGGWNQPAARAAAVQEIALSGAVGYAEPNLDQDMQVVPEDLSQLLGALAAQLPQAGREAVVAGATRVAVADGPVQPAERALIDAVGSALGMTSAHVAGVVATVAPAADAPFQGVAPQQPYPAPQPQVTTPDISSSMETMVVPPAQPRIPAQAPAPDTSSLETMIVPPASAPAVPPQPQAPVDSASQPTHVMQVPPAQDQTGWPQQ